MVPPLLQELIDGLAAQKETQAILLAGSRGKENTADATSDYDLYVYTDGEVPLEVRKKLLEGRCSVLELDNRYWESEDDGVLNDGTAFEVIYRNLADLDRHLVGLLEKNQVQTGYSTCFWANLLASEILFDREGKAEKLQKRFTVAYPQALVQAIVDKNWPLLTQALPAYSHQVAKALKRDDWVSINHRTAAFLASYFDILFAVNRRPHPGEKKLASLAEKLPLVPQDFKKNLAALRSHGGSDNLWIVGDLEALASHLGQVLVDQGYLKGQPSLPPSPPVSAPTPGPAPTAPLTVYTDGGCIGNPGKGAWAYIVQTGGGEKEGSGGEGLTTNNKMELQAVIQALTWIQAQGWTGRAVVVHTDSQYVKNGINEWIHAWERNGWKTAAKEPVKNKELWQALQVLQKALKPQWKWVKGHAGNPLNERCDRLVRRTMDSL